MRKKGLVLPREEQCSPLRGDEPLSLQLFWDSFRRALESISFLNYSDPIGASFRISNDNVFMEKSFS